MGNLDDEVGADSSDDHARHDDQMELAGAGIGALLAVAAAVGFGFAAGASSDNRVAAVLLAVAAVLQLALAALLLRGNRRVAQLGPLVVLALALAAAGIVFGVDGGVGPEPAEVAAAGPTGAGAEAAAAPEPEPKPGPDPDAVPAEQDHHDDGPVISLYDPRLTPEQREAARRLIADTAEGMAVYPDVESVLAAGYRSIGDGITGFEHFINPAFMADGIELDPNRIESIVARVNADGSRQIVSAMYLLGAGSTMDDVPDIAGPITLWHDHQDLCWEGIQVVGRVGPDGSCTRGQFRGTAPMMHVWLVPHPCGPFAGLEGHGGGCAHQH